MSKKFTVQDDSLTAPFLQRLFTNRVLHRLPTSISPNALTLCGGFFGCCTILIMWLFGGMTTIDDTSFNGWYLFGAALMVCYAVCDQLDGLQARRTKRSSPYGDFLDHWVDALLASLGPAPLLLLMGASLPLTVVFCIAAALAWWGSNWQTVRDYERKLPFLGGLEFCWIGACCLIITGIFGRSVWQIELAGISLRAIIITITFAGVVVCFSKNIIRNRDQLTEILTPLLSVSSLAVWLIIATRNNGLPIAQQYLGLAILGMVISRHTGDMMRKLWLDIPLPGFDKVVFCGSLLLLIFTSILNSQTSIATTLIATILLAGYAVFALMWQAIHTYMALTIKHEASDDSSSGNADQSKRIMVDMSAVLLHHGHIRLLQEAQKLGTVVVGLTTDEELIDAKKIKPSLDYAQRKEILESIRYVTEIVPTPWWITDEVLDQYNIDLLVHGDDNVNQISPERLVIVPRTADVSSRLLLSGIDGS